MSAGVLIVGLGQIGMGYDLGLDPLRYVQSHARAFSQHPAFHLVGAVDPDLRRREIFSQTYQGPAYADVETALSRHQPDLVVIATPTPTHRDSLLRVLALAHPKVVLCEKPLSYDTEEGRFMVRACLEKGVALYVNYMRRADPAVVEIKRRFDIGEITGPVKGVAWYSKGLLHNGSHFFNLLEYWLGPMQKSTVISTGRLWDGVDPEPDVHVQFANGEVTFLAAWEEAFSHYTIELLSSNGRLRYERGGSLVQWQASSADNIVEDQKSLSVHVSEIDNGMDRYQWHIANQMANVLRGEPFMLCTGTEALSTLAALNSILDARLCD